ncbi:Protein Dgcr6 [Manis pentadactyla]|nr:Protein Dgcr6 [Manis pentadactyla]
MATRPAELWAEVVAGRAVRELPGRGCWTGRRALGTEGSREGSCLNAASRCICAVQGTGARLEPEDRAGSSLAPGENGDPRPVEPSPEGAQ